jgi:hypothetical protein
MGKTMLEFAEAVLKEIRKLQQDSEALVLGGSVSDMERYRFLMGRLEGLKLTEMAVRDLTKRYQKDDF